MEYFLQRGRRHWFARQPSFTFNAPAQGYMDVQDLNGDGLSDIIWHDWDKHQLFIFMSPSGRVKGKNP